MNIHAAQSIMEPGRGVAHRPPSPDKILEKLDTNADGALTADEARGPLAKRFERIDGNGDGAVSREELERSFAAVQSKMAERMADKSPGFPGELMQRLSPERQASLLELLQGLEEERKEAEEAEELVASEAS